MTAGKPIFFALVFFCSVSLYAQKTKTQLQREKQENLEKIKETERILTETTTEKNMHP
jgi:hypothetical protein